MTAKLSLRIRTDDDREAVEALKSCMGEAAASKAIWQAIRDWPGLQDKLAEAHAALEHHRNKVRRLSHAQQSARAANAEVAEALTDLTAAK